MNIFLKKKTIYCLVNSFDLFIIAGSTKSISRLPTSPTSAVFTDPCELKSTFLIRDYCIFENTN